MDKNKLVDGCRKNKRKAQNELFRNYKGLVMVICRRYSNDVANCEDVFQECFIQIYKSLAKFDGDIVDLDKWIARVSINVNITNYYKSSKEQLTSVPNELIDESHKTVLDQLSGEAIVEIINGIPDGYRVIFNLFFIDGYKHKEIAEMLQITESTSRSQLVRAKEYLKKKLESQGIYRYEAAE